MEFKGEFFIGFFDLGFVGNFLYTENVVVISFPHHDGNLLFGFGLFFVHSFQLLSSYKCKFYMTIYL